MTKSRLLVEDPLVVQLVNKFPALYATCRVHKSPPLDPNLITMKSVHKLTMRSEVLTTVEMSMLVFWAVTRGFIGRCQNFGGAHCHPKESSMFPDTLTSTYKFTHCYTPED
jgi:hypothetical protein